MFPHVRPVVYIGTISYGIYLYHYAIFRDARPRMPGPPLLTFLIAAALSIGVAAYSFRYLEAPFLALKRRLGRPPSLSQGSAAPSRRLNQEPRPKTPIIGRLSDGRRCEVRNRHLGSQR